MNDPSGPNEVPSRRAAAWWRARVTVHQVARGITDKATARVRRHARSDALVDTPVLASSETPLWTESGGPEWLLTAGKVENLRRAARAFDGIEIPAGEVLSFWAQVGPPWGMRGYVEGREVREGCVVPSMAGGICQLSNALLDVSRRAGLEIVERHRHSRVLPESAAARDEDATVFWNHVDLRVRAAHAMRLEVSLTGESLVVRLRGDARRGVVDPRRVASERRAGLHLAGGETPVRSCYSCRKDECHKVRRAPSVQRGRTAWLLDGMWPEFDAYLRSEVSDDDEVFVPVDGRRWGRARYAWSTGGAGRVRQFPVLMALRAAQSRRLAAQGAARQRAGLRHDALLAVAMGRVLSPSITRVFVTQTLLPHLWARGLLGGRQFSVLMTRPPLSALQSKLDGAARLHPDSPTLADFRADEKLVALEEEALAAAESVVTPHAALASSFGARGIGLKWARPAGLPRRSTARPRPTVHFPMSTLGRKGVYELRAALRGLPVDLTLGGPVLERAGFWEGRATPGRLRDADVVVAPSFVESAPRSLLVALASGVPVIATPWCGIPPEPGLCVVPTGDAERLRHAIEEVLASSLAASAASVA